MNNLRISIIENYDDWFALSKEWNHLVNLTDTSSFFQTWEWNYSWGQCFLDQNSSPLILVVYKCKAIIGIAPLYIASRKIGPFKLNEIHFIGSSGLGSDYLAVITRKGREKDVADVIYDHLISGQLSSRWDRMTLNDIPADNLFLLHFMTRLEADGKYAEISRDSFCPRVKIANNEGEFYGMLSKRWRDRFKQDLRVINHEPQIQHEIIEGEKVSEKLHDFCEFYKEKSDWPRESSSHMLKMLNSKYIKDSPIQIHLLYLKDQLIAGLLHFKFQRVLAAYLMVVDKEYTHSPQVSFGNLLVGKAILNAMNNGYSVYDLLKGAERYKFHWATGGKCTLQLTVWQKRPIALSVASAKLAKHFCKLLLR